MCLKNPRLIVSLCVYNLILSQTPCHKRPILQFLRTIPFCVYGDCPLTHRCLRRNAYLALTHKQECMQVVNPEWCIQGEECKYFRDNTSVIYAKVFLNFQKKITLEQ